MEDRLDQLERQIDRLTRQNRNMKRCGFITLVCIGLGLTLGARGLNNDVVRASRFILEDDEGTTRAKLFVHENRTRFEMYDEHGHRTFFTSTDHGATDFRMLTGDGDNPTVLLYAGGNSGMVSITGKNGDPSRTIFADKMIVTDK